MIGKTLELFRSFKKKTSAEPRKYSVKEIARIMNFEEPVSADKLPIDFAKKVRQMCEAGKDRR